MREGRYSLRKYSGGVAQYAIVSVTLKETADGPRVEMSGDEFAWLKDSYGPNAWEWACCDDFRAGALRGAKYALDQVADSVDLKGVLVSINMIHATVADTTRDAVAYAACYATWDALGVAGVNPPEFVGRKVHFQDEGRP